MNTSRGFVSVLLILAIVLGIAALGGAGWWTIPSKGEADLTPPMSETTGTETGAGPTIQSFTGPHSLMVGETGTWNVQATGPANEKITYVITWGDEPALGPEYRDVTHPLNRAALGDGQTFSASAATHSYKKAGTYTVRLLAFGTDVSRSDPAKTFTVTVKAASMNTYTDSDFGFSFAYPNGWQVLKDKNILSIKNPETVGIDEDYNGTWVTIMEFEGNTAIEEDASRGDFKYTYTNGEMKVSGNEFTGSWGTPSLVQPVATTVGGIKVYPGHSRYGAVVVPLPGPKMLIARSYSGASSFVSALVGTVTLVSQPVGELQMREAFYAELLDRYYLLEICRQKGIADRDCPAGQ